jgi:hypothetical protein
MFSIGHRSPTTAAISCDTHGFHSSRQQRCSATSIEASLRLHASTSINVQLIVPVAYALMEVSFMATLRIICQTSLGYAENPSIEATCRMVAALSCNSHQ